MLEETAQIRKETAAGLARVKEQLGEMGNKFGSCTTGLLALPNPKDFRPRTIKG